MNAKGTGLGLSICKKIIEQMGGEVGFESEEGKGSKFHITICLKTLDNRMMKGLSRDLESDPEFLMKFKQLN